MERVRPSIRFFDPLLSILYITLISTIFNKISIYLGLGLFRTLSGPSAAARKPSTAARTPSTGARGPGAAAT